MIQTSLHHFFSKKVVEVTPVDVTPSIKECDPKINPLTNKPFEVGDKYGGKVFAYYMNGGESVKMLSEEAYERRLKRKERNKKNPALLNYIVTRLYSGAKRRSVLRGCDEPKLNRRNLTEIVKLGWCQETYPPLPLVLDNPGSPFSPSLDRIDNSKSYIDSNVRVSCVQVNMARNNFSDEDTILTCQRLSNFLIRKRNKRCNSI